MTPEHVIFIPTVFLLGFLAGVLLAMRRAAGLPVLLALSIALAVFALTHMTSLSFGARAVHEAVGGLPLFDQSPSFSAAAVLERLEAFGAEGREVYRRVAFTGDLIFPLSLLGFFLALAHFTIRHLPSVRWPRLLYALPLIWFGTDMVENAIIVSLLAAYPSSSATLAAVLGPVIALKLTLLPASLILPLAILALYRLNAVRRTT